MGKNIINQDIVEQLLVPLRNEIQKVIVKLGSNRRIHPGDVRDIVILKSVATAFFENRKDPDVSLDKKFPRNKKLSNDKIMEGIKQLEDKNKVFEQYNSDEDEGFWNYMGTFQGSSSPDITKNRLFNVKSNNIKSHKVEKKYTLEDIDLEPIDRLDLKKTRDEYDRYSSNLYNYLLKTRWFKINGEDSSENTKHIQDQSDTNTKTDIAELYKENNLTNGIKNSSQNHLLKIL